MNTPISAIQINNDINGNPRYVVHFLDFLTEAEQENINTRYKTALIKAKAIGGRKYDNKTYAGGIVFSTYNLHNTLAKIAAMATNQDTPKDTRPNYLKGLTLPLAYTGGRIVDGTGKAVILAERDTAQTPLSPAGRDAILQLACTLLNQAFEYDKADQILKSLGY